MGPAIAMILASLATAAGVILFRKNREKIRRQAAEQLAGQLGMHFSPDDVYGLLKQLKDFDLFSRERRRWFNFRSRVSNILRTEIDGTEVFCFEYSYVVSTGKSSRRVAQTVFFANDKNWYLPNFHLKPETWWRKALALFGKTDIDFPDSPEFSDRFWLTGEFESLIRKTFSPEVQTLLTERPPTHLEGNNYYLLAYKPRTVLGPAEAETFFQHFCRLIKLLKQEEKLELLSLAEIKTARTPIKAPDLPLKEF